MSVEALLAWYAETDPRQLDALEVEVGQDPDDPGWSEPRRQRMHEARRRLLERIGQARQRQQ